MKLYTYFRSSAAYRVRIALNLKGLAYETVPVHLLRNGGEQLQERYRTINPAGLVPSLQDGEHILTQSLAILEYLEEAWPDTPLLPAEPLNRARVRAMAQTIACEIHPLNNLRVLKYLTGTLKASEEEKTRWYRHWTEAGLRTLEALLAHAPQTGAFCHGDAPTIADCCLVPQVFNAQRFDVDMSAYPTVMAIHARCGELAAFAAAHPAQQPDAE
ncbi:MAG TPA: maleylacetoacetate isomerase [Noviherbaspirillum sp.]|uniref:maleylacetoacetate isomerase n=1 Tax=Noviherbaspirillum sp. TaxID=1926288 RepID=UPI002B4991EE|nr:maleylacetoacetate isomerase [Noviherbaspirillum sp.]HJV87655.1 maleylacetoacetate isomerase [Noviherbaspirillum sp.]